MDFNLTEEQQMLRRVIREFAEKELAPVAAQIDDNDRIPDDIIQKLAEIEIFGIPGSEKYGGAGRGYTEAVLALEEIARVSAAVSQVVAANYPGIFAIDKFGTNEQKTKYLPVFCQGNAILSFAFTEAATGSDPKAITTTAKLDGTDYVLNGEKRFITNSTLDGFIIIFARHDERISAFIAEKNKRGYSTSKPWRKMGLRGAILTDVYLDNMRVPTDNLLGSSGEGYTVLLDTVTITKLNVCAWLIGCAQAALEDAVKYAKDRTVRGRSIANLQTIQCLIADIATQLEAARWLTYRLASLVDQGQDARAEAALTKIFVSEMAVDVARKALEVHGAYGYVKDFKIERIYRDVKVGEIMEGTNEIQRVIVANSLLQ